MCFKSKIFNLRDRCTPDIYSKVQIKNTLARIRLQEIQRNSMKDEKLNYKILRHKLLTDLIAGIADLPKLHETSTLRVDLKS
jgi:hypothetical protein